MQIAMWTLFLVISPMAAAQLDLVQVRQDFSSDPGWDFKNNRVMSQDPPTIKQDFGWAATNHTAAAESGEIGGKMWQSQTPAYYAMPLNRPLSFKEPFSFSCRVAFMPTGGAGVAYLGFFNHKLQGWRVWNSMAVRLGGESSGEAAFGADSMNSLWQACGGTEGYIHVPVDGKPHILKFTYDPAETPGDWPDPSLSKWVKSNRLTTEQILEAAQKDEPGLTKEQLVKRLEEAHAAGLVQYLQRTGHESVIGRTTWSGKFWLLAKGGKSGARVAMIIQVDDGRPFKFFLNPKSQDSPVSMDRFGLFNLQLYHQFIDLYISDLTVNGHKVDLSKDPGWEGQGNRVEFVEQDFHRHNYGYSETNWAGESLGEVGGQVGSAEPVDPITGYYGDDVGKLTLDDPVSFSGSVCFVNDSTDAGMQFGYFNSADTVSQLDPKRKLHTVTNTLGIFIEGSASGGKKFGPQVTSSKDTDAIKHEILFPPTKERHTFKVEYDPKANNNLGTLTVTLDDKTSKLNLTAQQRAEGATFDRFGLVNLRCGGKFVTLYFDDLTYTARRGPDYKPVFHKQEVTKVAYPKTGREY